MANGVLPVVGNWYLSPNGSSFEVVACDLEHDSVDIQYFDGALEELDLDSWYELTPDPTSEPEDWTGAMDVEPDDLGLDLNMTGYEEWVNPLDRI